MLSITDAVVLNMLNSNPMLGETFEDARMKLIVEKVRHNPVEMAYHAEGNGWEFYGTAAGKTKFWGQCFFVKFSS